MKENIDHQGWAENESVVGEGDALKAEQRIDVVHQQESRSEQKGDLLDVRGHCEQADYGCDNHSGHEGFRYLFHEAILGGPAIVVRLRATIFQPQWSAWQNAEVG